MTIWILALVLLASCMALGHKMGAIRVAISLAGILISALLAWPMSGLVKPLLKLLGVHNPVTLWLLSPVIVFVILMCVFKSAAFYVHRKVEVYYRYQRDDLRFMLWERANRWLGFCLGPVNALIYLVLLSSVIYSLSYWTAQLAASEDEKWTLRSLDRMGHDLEETGMGRVARSINTLPEIYFKAADLAGMLYQNPQLQDRLSRYPAFLSLAERDDFRNLGQNAEFQGAWKNRLPVSQMMAGQQFAAIWGNETSRDLVWDIVRTNLDDLQGYLQTGRSAKFDSEPILGRWDINVVATLWAMVQARPNVPTPEMQALRTLWFPAYTNTVLVAGSEGGVFLENLPHFKVQPNQPATFDTATWQGQWSADSNGYSLSFASGGQNKSGTATIDGSRLTLVLGTDTLIFDRE